MDWLLSLSPIEKKVLPFVELKNIQDIVDRSGLDEQSVRRALQFLSNKKLINLKKTSEKILDLDVNGVLYKKQGLPERRFLTFIAEKVEIPLEEARKQAGLSENEFMIALGILKEKGMIRLESGNIILNKSKEELVKHFPEEKLLELLPKLIDDLTEYQYIINSLKKRKNILIIEEKETLEIEITPECKDLVNKLKNFKQELIEQLTPEMIKNKKWKGKKFRMYDVKVKAPIVYGGKRQLYLKFLSQVKQELISLGFQEFSGPIVENSFFNCDSLFMPQNHPARGIHDLYLVPGKADLKKYSDIINNVKKTHEDGWKTGSDGWKYDFSEEETSKLLLRSQGTAISSRTLASNPKIPGKYFAVARVFRPDILDSSHLTEFNQLEGIIIGDVNFRHLLGLLKLFAEKIAKSKQIKLVPSYFPFTEPSVELQAYFDGKWLELGGAGIFRPEVTLPLGIDPKTKVIAWGLGIDRLFMIKEKITDIRELFSQDINFLRKS